MPVPCHTWMPETLTMMMLLAPLRPSQLWRGIKSQFFTRAAPSADDPRAEIARLSVSQRAAFQTPNTDVYDGGPLWGPQR